MGLRLILSIVALIAASGHAGAAQLNSVVVGDVQGTHGKSQGGEVTVAAPAAEVRRWFVEVPSWPARFPDDVWARELGTDARGRHVVQFYSRMIGRTMTLHVTEQPGLITYEGEGKSVTTHGRVYIQPLGPNQTRITMTTTGELHGAAALFASPAEKRKRALEKITADLNATVALANAWAAAHRPVS